MLLPVEFYLILKENNCKQNLIWTSGFNGGKKVVTLLKKVGTIYVDLITIDDKKLDFELDFKGY